MGTSRVDVGDVGERGWWSEVFCCVKPRIWLWTYNCKSVCLAMDVQLQVRVSGHGMMYKCKSVCLAMHVQLSARPCVWPCKSVQLTASPCVWQPIPERLHRCGVTLPLPDSCFVSIYVFVQEAMHTLY